MTELPVPVTADHVAMVTGGARGIGAATARRLAADGMAVAVVDLLEDTTVLVVAEITADGGQAVGIGADVTSADDVRRAVATTEQALGPPTVLVSNAGILRDNLLFKMSEEDWDAVVAVHLRGAFLMSREVQAHQVRAGWAGS